MRPPSSHPYKQNAFREIIPSGSLWLDIGLGIGGYPRGRFIEISGPPASGKTTLGLHIIAEEQKIGGACTFIDADHSLDPDRAQRCGIDAHQLLIAGPESAEQALDITLSLARSGSMSLIVMDSISALISRSDLERPFDLSREDDNHLLLSRALRMLSPVIRQNNTTIIFTHHGLRQRGAVYHKLAANTARLALKLHCSIRIRLRPISTVLDNGQAVGERVRIDFIKNSLAPCLHRPELDIMYNDGIRRSGEVLDLGLSLALITKNGPNFVYKAHQLGTGRKAALQFLDQNGKIRDEIEQVIRWRLLPE